MNTATTYVPPRKALITAAFALATAVVAALIAFAPNANAMTRACQTGDSGFCGGQKSIQAAPLELAVAVPISQVHAGTTLVGMGPAFNGREDWDARVPSTGGSGSGGPNKVFRFAPRGTPVNLCLTAISDVARSAPALEPCVSGTAGSSHQVWSPQNVRNDGSVVWRNVANGLALTFAGDFQGAPVQIRSIGTGTGTNKNLVFVGTAP